ncbi:MAG: flagellar basal body-associated FliL family protein [Lachnospiraceae bacterium]|nr:flagellar basal body-associated FliL family protein [Lachnospiraceae bacterium]MDE7272648.1 flagellar basal body-associated FliL family protein [Lachnospiraceae bacterium]
MKRNLLSIIILALLVVNIVLSAIMMVSVSSASKKTASLVADIATIVGIEINGLPQSDITQSVSMADTAVHNVDGELTIPLKKGEDGADHYAVGSVSLSMDTKNKDYKNYAETMSEMDGIIKDIVFAVMGNYTVDEARSSSDSIKSEILARLQERFGSTFIYDVSYNFLYN